jgi:hypothetical protein
MKTFKEKSGFGIEFETKKFIHRIGFLRWKHYKFWKIFHITPRTKTEIKIKLWQIRILNIAYANVIKKLL